MALEGTIKEFGIADILQLIAQQQKTGILVVEKKDEQAEIHFGNGILVEIRHVSKKLKRDQLGKMLFDAQLISAKDLESALKAQQETYEYIGQIFLKRGLISKENLERAIITQTYETFYDILQWRDGIYRFMPEKRAKETGLDFLPGLESILLDVFRMIDEWPEVHKTIHSFELIPAKAPEAPHQAYDTDTMLILSLIDAQRTVQALIQESLLGRFTTCKILLELLDSGAIQLLPARGDTPGRMRADALPKVYSAVAYGVLGMLLISAGMTFAVRGPARIVPLLDREMLRQSALGRCQDYASLAAVRKALDIYYLKYGEYPRSVTELVRAGILRTGDLRIFEKSAAVYEHKGDGYSLSLKPTDA